MRVRQQFLELIIHSQDASTADVRRKTLMKKRCEARRCGRHEVFHPPHRPPWTLYIILRPPPPNWDR